MIIIIIDQRHVVFFIEVQLKTHMEETKINVLIIVLILIGVIKALTYT